MPRRARFALTSDGSFATVVRGLPRKYSDDSIASLSHVSLNAVCFHGTPIVISLQAWWPLQAPTPSPIS